MNKTWDVIGQSRGPEKLTWDRNSTIHDVIYIPNRICPSLGWIFFQKYELAINFDLMHQQKIRENLWKLDWIHLYSFSKAINIWRFFSVIKNESEASRDKKHCCQPHQDEKKFCQAWAKLRIFFNKLQKSKQNQIFFRRFKI